jgi:DNA polymerase-3 subunit delta'
MNREATEELARRGQLYPAVILHGGSAEERRDSALRLARLLLCEEEAEDRPCGGCRHCTRIDWPGEGRDCFHPDFRILERDLKTSTSVEGTKAFLQLAQVSPFEARGQVFVIASADTLTGEAANALLKSLEEPPARSPRHFLLLCPSQFDLLPTVRSRSLPVYLGATRGVDVELVAKLADRFAVDVEKYLETQSSVYLLAAAEGLADAGSWQDPRDSESWTLAASVVKESRSRLPAVIGRQLLGLAEELLSGWRLRLRGIQAQRILEGLVVQQLSQGTKAAS